MVTIIGTQWNLCWCHITNSKYATLLILVVYIFLWITSINRISKSKSISKNHPFLKNVIIHLYFNTLVFHTYIVSLLTETFLIYRYNVMLKCWNSCPNHRPSFTDLRNFFEDLVEEISDYLNLDYKQNIKNKCVQITI